MTGKKRLFAIIAILGLVILIIVVVIFILPQFSGEDEEAVVKAMPADTAVFLEVDLRQLQNEAAQQLVSAWFDSFEDANIPVDENDPITLLNALDIPLDEIAGVTIHEDIRPWIGSHIGLGLLPSEDDTPTGWIIAAAIQRGADVDPFIEKLTANLADQNGVSSGAQIYQPLVKRDNDVLIIASDDAALAKSLAAREGSNLTNSTQFQEMLTELPEASTLTGFADGVLLTGLLTMAVSESEGSAGIAEAVRGVLPEYTAVGMAGFAVEEGIQLELVGFHNELNETQTTWLEAQTPNTELDEKLPEDTAVFLTGHRLDLIWQLLKGALSGLGYAEADIDESMQLFDQFLGFNPDDDLLATLSDEYAAAVLPIEGNLAPVGLVQHSDPAALTAQIARLSAGLRLLGLSVRQSDGIFELDDADGQQMVAFSQLEDVLLLSDDDVGLTAVIESTSSLAQNPAYQTAWQSFPEDALPVLFVNFGSLPTAVDMPPFSHAAYAAKSDPETSRGTLILFIPMDTE